MAIASVSPSSLYRQCFPLMNISILCSEHYLPLNSSSQSLFYTLSLIGFPHVSTSKLMHQVSAGSGASYPAEASQGSLGRGMAPETANNFLSSYWRTHMKSEVYICYIYYEGLSSNPVCVCVCVCLCVCVGVCVTKSCLLYH